MPRRSLKQRVWDKARTVPHKDPNMYRRDTYGTELYWPSYGKNSEKGWVLDHMTPRAKGGSDAVRNLQILSTRTNLEKGASLRKRSRHSKRNEKH